MNILSNVSFLRRVSLSLLLLLSAFSLTVSAAILKEGKDYQLLSSKSSNMKNGIVEVKEFFWYGCPHCFKVEASVQSYVQKEDGKSIHFIREALPYSGKTGKLLLQSPWTLHARLYYTFRKLGIESEASKFMFHAIHVEHVKNELIGAREVYDALRTAGLLKGITQERFLDVYGSKLVMKSLKRTLEEAKEFNVQGVPTFIIDNRIMVSGANVGTEESLVSRIQEVVALVKKGNL